jgi:mRNA interferase RelE/StbE
VSLYQVQVSKSAAKEIEKLPPAVVERIIPALIKLAEDPRPTGCKKLKGTGDIYRIRVGDYRIIYVVDDTVRIVDIRKVGHRRDVYE